MNTKRLMKAVVGAVCGCLALSASLCMAGNASESDQISISVRLTQGDDLISAPSVTMLPGKECKIEVTSPFTHPDGRSLPVGVILDSLADFTNGMIKYSCLLTIREHQETKDVPKRHQLSAFKTQEFIFTGLAEPGKEIRTELADKMVIVLVFNSVALDSTKIK